jgi:hygromycin-B 7''-O-kinase
MLPAITTLDEYRPIYRSEAVWLPAMHAICQRHGLDPASLSFAPPGSNVVFWAGQDLVIKLFAPMWQADAAKEARWLDTLSTQTQVHIPRVVARGDLEGWPYLLLSRVPGIPLDEIWADLTFEGQLRIAASLGACIAVLHRVAVADIENGRNEWLTFRQSQLLNCPANQSRLGLDPAWVDQIATWIERLPPLSAKQPDLVLVNGDLNPEHLLCEQDGQGWHVTGFIDYADAIIAHPYYDLVRPGFIMKASPLLRRAMLLAYGFSSTDLSPALSDELFAYTLAHRFASIPETLGELDRAAPRSLAGLVKTLWGF